MYGDEKYRISRIVICVITFLVTFVGCINEDATFRAVAETAFTIVTSLAGLIGTPVSKRIIEYGNIGFNICNFVSGDSLYPDINRAIAR